MKILVTGGAGFIGSHIVDAYVGGGHEVAILDNLATGLRANLHPEIIFYHCNITDEGEVARCFDDFRPDVVSHHAAQIDVCKALDDPAYDASINIMGSLNVLLNAVRTGAQRFVFASSGGAVYGEPHFLPITEDHPITPASPYGISKFAFEQYLRVWHTVHPIKTIILRYANVYGPRQGGQGESGVVAIFANSLLQGQPCTVFGDGTATRDYVFVSDVVAANQAALHRGDNTIINIGTGQKISTRRVFETMREAFGCTSVQPLDALQRVGEVTQSCLSIDRARQVLGWQPQVDFQAGVRSTLEWYRKIQGEEPSAPDLQGATRQMIGVA
jgi:UDP-glucose 4-epimerase